MALRVQNRLGLERRIEEREENFIYTVFPYLRIPHLSCIVPRLSNFVPSPQNWNPSFHLTTTCMYVYGRGTSNGRMSGGPRGVCIRSNP